MPHQRNVSSCTLCTVTADCSAAMMMPKKPHVKHTRTRRTSEKRAEKRKNTCDSWIMPGAGGAILSSGGGSPDAASSMFALVRP